VEDRNRGRWPRRRNQKGEQSDINGNDSGQIKERGRHGQAGQEVEDRIRNSAQYPPEQPPPIIYPNCLSWANGWLSPDNLY
jgi:hypothetical protein